MKRHFLVIVILAISYMTFLSSCKKDDEETKKDLITARWQGKTVATNVTLNGVALPVETEDISDTFLNIKSGGTYDYEINGVTDNPGTWKLSNGDKELIFDEGADDEIVYIITSLTSNDLKLSFSQEYTQDGATIRATGVVNFKK